MAERRMFAKSVVLADAFLDLPHRVRNLYFMLGMVADDDGFVNAPKSIVRQAGARRGDLELLVQKGYVLEFESGVVAIRHWRVHNYIQKDRYKPTACQTEKNLVKIGPDGLYTEWIQDGYDADTQVRAGKDRSGQDRAQAARAGEGVEEKILDSYNRICTGLVRCDGLTRGRRQRIRARLEDGMGLADFERVFARAQKSGFLKGGGAKGWVAGFDWVLDAEHMARIDEGEFDDRGGVPKGASGELGDAELEAIRKLLEA